MKDVQEEERGMTLIFSAIPMRHFCHSGGISTSSSAIKILNVKEIAIWDSSGMTSLRIIGMLKNAITRYII